MKSCHFRLHNGSGSCMLSEIESEGEGHIQNDLIYCKHRNIVGNNKHPKTISLEGSISLGVCGKGYRKVENWSSSGGKLTL